MAFAELPYVTVLTRLMQQLATEHMSAGELDSYVAANLGFLSFTTEVATQPNWKLARPRLLVSAGALSEKMDALATIPREVWSETLFEDTERMRDVLTQTFTTEVATQPNWKLARPRLLVSAGALSEKMDALATIPREVWSETLFEDTERMRDVLTQTRIGMEQSFLMNGHSAALARALATIPREVWSETLFEDTERMRDVLTQTRIGMEQSFLMNGHSAALARAMSYVPREVWSETLFEDTERMRDVLTQTRIGMEQSFLMNGHSAALARAMSYVSPAAVLTQQLSGVDFYLFLRDLLEHFDECKDDLCRTLRDLRDPATAPPSPAPCPTSRPPPCSPSSSPASTSTCSCATCSSISTSARTTCAGPCATCETASSPPPARSRASPARTRTSNAIGPPRVTWAFAPAPRPPRSSTCPGPKTSTRPS